MAGLKVLCQSASTSFEKGHNVQGMPVADGSALIHQLAQVGLPYTMQLKSLYHFKQQRSVVEE